ncbi:MAG TPA: amidohydrolase family protein [Chloroflexota bacterium]|jgi:2,3-dihydroxybenzoate decarboxylase|nr:amidohydrolase family protein [Chloroflexota bacterium]
MPSTASVKPFVIAIEEHYTDPAVMARGDGAGRGGAFAALTPRLNDLGQLRLQEMDAAGIDLQVLSHAPSPIQQLDAAESRQLATEANDRLHDAVDRNPERFAAFAALPTMDPGAAADELERTVTRLGFKGAMIHGRTRDQFHDLQKFWPIFERAERLDVPIYIHPGPPHPAMQQAYYADYLADFPSLASAAWGFTIDTANQVVRLILSGLFEAHPRLNIIVGHMGETLPFLVDRIDEALKRSGNKPVSFKDTFLKHVYVTTSGHFSTPALLCTLLEMGIDHILFSVDWPYVENEPGMRWMETVPLSAADKEKMFNGNARRLLNL